MAARIRVAESTKTQRMHLDAFIHEAEQASRRGELADVHVDAILAECGLSISDYELARAKQVLDAEWFMRSAPPIQRARLETYVDAAARALGTHRAEAAPRGFLERWGFRTPPPADYAPVGRDVFVELGFLLPDDLYTADTWNALMDIAERHGAPIVRLEYPFDRNGGSLGNGTEDFQVSPQLIREYRRLREEERRPHEDALQTLDERLAR